MKTQKLYKHLFFLLILFPVSLQAQWSMVRFDHYNTFQKILAVNTDNAFVIGTEPMNQRFFVLRTNDGGKTWDSLNVNPDGTLLEMRELQFIDKNTGFIGGSKDLYQHLLKTTDNGQSWTNITPAVEQYKDIIAVSFADADNGFASNGEKFYKTTNGGATWQESLPGFSPRDIAFTDENNGFASGTEMDSMYRAVIMKTTDGGKSWQNLLAVKDPDLFVSSFEKIDFIDAQTFLTSLQNSNKIYRTTNGGQSWDTITVDSAMYIADYDFTSALSGHVLSEKGQIFYTNDGGKTWKLQYSAQWGAYGPDVYLLSISINNGIGYVSGSNGLIKKYKEGTVSIADQQSALQLNVYPNPIASNGILGVEMPANSGSNELILCNAFGQIVMHKKLTAETLTSVQLSDLNLSSGLYYLTVKNNDQQAVTKLILTK